MPKITYLIGAGASAKAHPLIKKSEKGNGIASSLEQFINESYNDIINFNSPDGDGKRNELIDLVKGCKEFGTPDLFAKYLLEKGNDKSYLLLKKLLSSFFYTREYVKNIFDYRALAFLTTITQNKKIPDCIKVISWNYDTQIEMAAQKLSPFKTESNSHVNGFTSWPYINPALVSDENNLPFLLHLNGIAGFRYSPSSFVESEKKIYDFTNLSDYEGFISFAWEDKSNDQKNIFHEKRLSIAEKMVDDTEILVVIGYSFPFFNRKIDEHIFRSMIRKLRKIYFQDPYLNGQQLVGLFPLATNVRNNIIHIEQVDNYHIPYEL